ncbi:MAG: Mur ligase family protein [Mariprofundaceae bacterium]|nr:Mur ligase family protein [Mariprofundaceae bacterium]
MSEVDEWLSCLGRPGADRDYQPGHARMHALLTGLTLQAPKLRIRVAGTNGKGSTSFMLANALQACGYSVGLYTSPHVHAFRERIRVNLEAVDDAVLLAMLKTLLPKAKEVGASYFETATALALQSFSMQQVDIEILEAGVGARLDATTAVPADMAVLTPIALDHMDWLGETLAKVTQEKAHAMDGCRFSISAPQTQEVQVVLKQHASLSFAPQQAWPHLQIAGKHQQLNASVAYAALALLPEKITLDLQLAKQAIQATKVYGRLQKVQYGQANIWLDAAHNGHAIMALLESLKDLADPFDVIFCFSREDRDLSEHWPALAQYTKKLVNHADVKCIEDALALHLKSKGNYLVLGSFVTVDKAQCYLKNKKMSVDNNA